MIKKTMTGLLIIGFVATSLFLTSSCQSTKVIGPTPEEIAVAEKEAADKVAVDKAAQEAEAAKARAAKAKQEQEDRIRRERDRAAMMVKQEMAAVESEKVYFDYDSSELTPDSREALTKKATWLKANMSYKIKIEGHCDDRGSTEYNLALGERRAESAFKFLGALGVASSRITTVTYGEEKPAETGKNETAWSQNRRDEFILIK